MTRLDRCEGVARSPGAAEAHLNANQALTRIQGDEINLALGRPIPGGKDPPVVAGQPLGHGLLGGSAQGMPGIRHESVAV